MSKPILVISTKTGEVLDVVDIKEKMSFEEGKELLERRLKAKKQPYKEEYVAVFPNQMLRTYTDIASDGYGVPLKIILMSAVANHTPILDALKNLENAGYLYLYDDLETKE